MKYYVTADIHGFFTPMMKALTDAGYFSDPQPHNLIILGDVLDRGREAQKVQQFILDEMDKDRVILIRGNHEDLFEEMVNEDKGKPYSHHVSNGTYDSALQLTGYDPVMASIRSYDFADAAKETAFFLKIMPSMKDYYETEHYIFVHGWIPCLRDRGSYSYIGDWRTAENLWPEARWLNGMEVSRHVTENGKTIVCGHWHASYGHSALEGKGSEFGPDADFTPYYGQGVIALDACTAVSGFVNCIVIED